MPVAGERLSWTKALGLCWVTGWRGHQLTVAVALMTAESSRYVEAWHVNADQSIDRGLFQINSKNGYSEKACYDPMRNAAIAFDMSKGGSDWTAWAAYNSKAYRKYIPTVLYYKARGWKHWKNYWLTK